ncbi:MAG TPA: hypothetical protein VM470_05340 [Acidimicrobiia bacterium]|nr:hypothetical protein [Acidimicrobiia bacterium]
MQAAGALPRFQRWVPVAVVAGVSLIVLAMLNPFLILAANTPSGGDMAAHVVPPAYLRDVLLPEGRILGWSQDWFAGYPVFYFYFPLPSLVIVLLDLILPYGVAFKVVAVAGLLATPPAVYFLARTLRFGRPVATVAAGAGATFIFMESFTIYGANAASTLAGEFSFSWSFVFSLVYLALLIKTVRDDRRYAVLTAVALALCALSHIITTILIVVASLSVLIWKDAWRRVIPIWLGAFAITSFWSVPLLARLGYSSDMAWVPLRTWEEIFPIEIWLLLPAAVAGMVWAVRRTPRVLPVIALTVLPIIYYPLPLVLPEVFPDIFTGRWKLWNGRLLPYWYFGVSFFAALALGGFAVWAARRLPPRVSRHWPRLLWALAILTGILVAAREPTIPRPVLWIAVALGAALLGVSLMWRGRVDTRTLLAITGAGLMTLGAAAGITFVNGWATWNFTGYEGKAKWPEYEALMTTASSLPEGRIQWEYDRSMNEYGSPMALMLFPYWTEEDHTSMEGLFFESSLTTPFHFLNQAETSANPSSPIPGLNYHRFALDRGIEHMQLFGITYYVTYTPEAKAEAETFDQIYPVASSGPFTFFRFEEVAMVEPAAFLPAVYEGHESSVIGKMLDVIGIGPRNGEMSFGEFALEWYDDLDLIDRWVTADGPAAWPRIDSLAEIPATRLEAAGEVSDVVIDDHSISFRTTAVGIPHLVKVSYFPNWRASGAEGPYHATPSFMVVVPTQEEVVLQFVNTWVENVGWLFTAGGVIGAAVLTIRRRLMGSVRSSPAAP